MSIKATIIMLRKKMETQLKAVNTNNAVNGYDECHLIAKNVNRELRDHIADHPFEDTEEEVRYFKEILPFFQKEYIYYSWMYKLEVFKISHDRAEYFNRLEEERRKIDEFQALHASLQLYYYSGKTHRDLELFTSGTRIPSAENLYFQLDDQSCEASWNIGKLLAEEQIRSFIHSTIGPVRDRRSKTVEIRLRKSMMIEWLIGTCAAEIIYIQGVPASIPQLIKLAQPFCKYDLNAFYSIDGKNRMRKKDATPFINMLRNAYQSRSAKLE